MQHQDPGRGATATAHNPETDAAASYGAVLQSDAGLARRTYDDLLEAHRTLRLEIQNRLLCNVLRPRFMSQARVEELRRVSGILASLLERTGQHLLSSDSLLDLVGASEQERAIWAVDPGYEGITLTSRLDSFMVRDRPKFVEYNAESPAAIGYCDCLSEVFERSPAMVAWGGKETLERFHARRALLDTLLWAYRARGGAGKPTIAIVDWEDVLTRRDFELCGEFFEERGLRVMVTDPRRFDYVGGRLRLNGEEVSLVYRRVLLHELLNRAGEAEPLLRAYREGAVCMVNSPRSKLLHKKAVFALLSDRRLGLHMSPEEDEVVRETIPWTRLLIEGETDYEGRCVDLATLLASQPSRFALKPMDDYGGRGVVLGWMTDNSSWERAIEDGLRRPHVVQERVEVPAAPFPIWKDDHVEIVPLLLDTNPLLFRGRMEGVLTRISDDPLLNVSAGTGSTTPTFAVREAEK